MLVVERSPDHHRLGKKIDGLGCRSSVPLQHCLTGASALHLVSDADIQMVVIAVGTVAGDVEEVVVDDAAVDHHTVLAVVVVACTADDLVDVAVGTGPGNR